jgi:hypothetical protein
VAKTSEERQAYANRMRRLTLSESLDGPAGADMMLFTPLARRKAVAEGAVDLGQGLTLGGQARTPTIPEQARWTAYAELRVRDLAQHLGAREGPYAAGSHFGQLRQYQLRVRIAGYQLLHSLALRVTVLRTVDALTWSQAWLLMCGVVSANLFSKPFVVQGAITDWLTYARDAPIEQLRELSRAPSVMGHIVDMLLALNPTLMSQAKHFALECARLEAGRSGGAAKGNTAASTEDTGNNKNGKSLCGVAGCSYRSPSFSCTHAFVVNCDNTIMNSKCNLPHARGGENARKWLCREALAAKQILSQKELGKAFLTSCDKWKEGLSVPVREKFAAAVMEIEARMDKAK